MSDFNSFNKYFIKLRAETKWNKKSTEERLKHSSKYKFLNSNLVKHLADWSNKFEDLSKIQQNILIKGELIRTYDALPNTEKTIIMRRLCLSSFSSKWYRLKSVDKKKLLNYVLN